MNIQLFSMPGSDDVPWHATKVLVGDLFLFEALKQSCIEMKSLKIQFYERIDDVPDRQTAKAAKKRRSKAAAAPIFQYEAEPSSGIRRLYLISF